MGPNIYLYQKAHEAHYQDLLREAEKERCLHQGPDPDHQQACRCCTQSPGQCRIDTWNIRQPLC